MALTVVIFASDTSSGVTALSSDVTVTVVRFAPSLFTVVISLLVAFCSVLSVDCFTVLGDVLSDVCPPSLRSD